MIVPVPPVALNVMLPFEPKQFGFVPLANKLIAVGIAIVICFVAVQPFASVATMVYIPDADAE